MNQSLAIIAALSIALSITACRNEGKVPEPSPSPQAAVEATVSPAVTAAPAPEQSASPEPSASPGPQSKPGEKFDFRGTRWGMSKAEVKKAEPHPPGNETEDSLSYRSSNRDQLTYITYQFKDGKLYRAGVLYPEKLSSDSLYLENYEGLKQEVIKAYGKPALDEEKLLNPDAVIQPDKKAEAVCRGDLTLGAEWNVPGSMVVLMFRGDGEKCLVSLIYM
ncbi:MAG: hypothetical protein ACREOP_15225, partial [Thermodesulfobacteriota bacterium]